MKRIFTVGVVLAAVACSFAADRAPDLGPLRGLANHRCTAEVRYYVEGEDVLERVAMRFRAEDFSNIESRIRAKLRAEPSWKQTHVKGAAPASGLHWFERRGKMGKEVFIYGAPTSNRMLLADYTHRLDTKSAAAFRRKHGRRYTAAHQLTMRLKCEP
jgi:hypothetical protein